MSTFRNLHPHLLVVAYHTTGGESAPEREPIPAPAADGTNYAPVVSDDVLWRLRRDRDRRDRAELARRGRDRNR